MVEGYMVFEKFYSGQDGHIHISADQASRFAKEVAGDYNPLHDANSRRFCVPGDLLFALVLARFGLYQRMSFRFHSMVGARALLKFRKSRDDMITVEAEGGKVCLEVEHGGAVSDDETIVEGFVRRYVAFSGLNFPHYLKPLFEEKGVMFSPHRPLVIYDRMDFSLEELPVSEPDVAFAGGSLDIEGKRALVRFEFDMKSGEKTVGTGSKKLVIGGLIPYSPQLMDDSITEFNRLKSVYEESKTQPEKADN